MVGLDTSFYAHSRESHCTLTSSSCSSTFSSYSVPCSKVSWQRNGFFGALRTINGGGSQKIQRNRNNGLGNGMGPPWATLGPWNLVCAPDQLLGSPSWLQEAPRPAPGGFGAGSCPGAAPARSCGGTPRPDPGKYADWTTCTILWQRRR